MQPYIKVAFNYRASSLLSELFNKERRRNLSLTVGEFVQFYEMGDMTKNFEILKKMGFLTTSNQWLLYDQRYDKFFNFFTQNITDVNVISEEEAFELTEINFSETNDIDELKKLEEIMPGLATFKDNTASLSDEISALIQSEHEYLEIMEMARSCKHKANARVNELEDENVELQTKEKELLGICQNQAKQLEALQEENNRLNKESRSCYSTLSPPALFCQLPLEEYYTKCDSFNQYLTLYIQENYKMQELMKHDSQNNDLAELSYKLNNLKEIIEDFTLKCYEEKAKAQATQAMIDGLEFNQMYTLNIDDMERECHELELLNEHHLKVAKETLLYNLKTNVQQYAQQRVEYVLYENTKYKLERALKRRQNGKDLERIITNALLNAELVWVAIQLDLDRLHNRIDTQKQQSSESQASWRRIKQMHNLNAQSKGNNLMCMFLNILTDLIAETGNGQRVRYETKACLHEYEKFGRLVSYEFQNMINGRAYQEAKERIQELINLESAFSPLVYDSPIEAPLLYDVKYLRPLFNVILQHSNIAKDLRALRLQFQTNINEKMAKDPLFRASQLLWIWFLQQPKRMLIAIEEIKREASANAIPNVKIVSGIKRKQ